MTEPHIDPQTLLRQRLAPYWGKHLIELKKKGRTGHKGWAGDLLEDILGVTDKSSSGPDFPEMGIELKTLPVSENFHVLENTFLGKIPLPFQEGSLKNSRLYQKIRQIFWVPLIGNKGEPLEQRRIGQGFLWQLHGEELSVFEQDWDELSSLLRSAEFGDISAHLGTALHIRPKAAHSRDKVLLNIDGQTHTIVPLGFYLRRSFTQKLLNDTFGLEGVG